MTEKIRAHGVFFRAETQKKPNLVWQGYKGEFENKDRIWQPDFTI
jgi:hypothetical protein